MPKVFKSEIKDVNSAAVASIENHASNSIELTLDGVLDFINNRHADLYTNYKVFKEQFVVCWARQCKKGKGKDLLQPGGYRADQRAGAAVLFRA